MYAEKIAKKVGFKYTSYMQKIHKEVLRKLLELACCVYGIAYDILISSL